MLHRQKPLLQSMWLGVLFLIWFKTTGFYWSYTLLLKPLTLDSLKVFFLVLRPRLAHGMRPRLDYMDTFFNSTSVGSEHWKLKPRIGISNLCGFTTLTTPTCESLLTRAFWSVNTYLASFQGSAHALEPGNEANTYLDWKLPTVSEKELLRVKGMFSVPVYSKRRESVHLAPTKAFLWPAETATMCTAPCA